MVDVDRTECELLGEVVILHADFALGLRIEGIEVECVDEPVALVGEAAELGENAGGVIGIASGEGVEMRHGDAPEKTRAAP